MTGSFVERYLWWARELRLQPIIWQPGQLSPLGKVRLSLWSYGYYLWAFGFRGMVRQDFKGLHQLYRLLRDGGV
jgi:hypothetical protein